ncbi:uncharacterized protein LOC143469219 [Clavelina lepadiformis]|uniref:uncharacterized protein LOC143469219 n=1 Tax=Clavelina lepadiformis TaxID=159417 RepID=UPI0040416878
MVNVRLFCVLFLLVVCLRHSTSNPIKIVSKHCNHRPTRTVCKLNLTMMALWCDQSNFTTIPQPEKIFARAPPEKSYSLYLNQSCVDHLDKDIIVKYIYLEELVLSENYIEELPKEVFITLDRLESLQLSKNKIKRFDDSTLTGLTKLRRLHIDHNLLTTLSDDVFHDVTNLQILKLNNNRLSAISPHTFAALTNLLELDLSGNHLGRFDSWQISGVSKLSVLNLHNNQLEYFGATLASVPHLEEIDLSNNTLKCLDDSLFRFKYKKLLSLLRLNGNQLETPKPDWFRGLKADDDRLDDVASLTSGNEWVCNCDVKPYLIFLQNELRSEPELASILNVQCSAPARLKGRMLMELSDSDLSPNGTCPYIQKYPECPKKPSQQPPPRRTMATTSPPPTPSPHNDVGNDVGDDESDGTIETLKYFVKEHLTETIFISIVAVALIVSIAAVCCRMKTNKRVERPDRDSSIKRLSERTASTTLSDDNLNQASSRDDVITPGSVCKRCSGSLYLDEHHPRMIPDGSSNFHQGSFGDGASNRNSVDSTISPHETFPKSPKHCVTPPPNNQPHRSTASQSNLCNDYESINPQEMTSPLTTTFLPQGSDVERTPNALCSTETTS